MHPSVPDLAMIVNFGEVASSGTPAAFSSCMPRLLRFRYQHVKSTMVSESRWVTRSNLTISYIDAEDIDMSCLDVVRTDSHPQGYPWRMAHITRGTHATTLFPWRCSLQCAVITTPLSLGWTS